MPITPEQLAAWKALVRQGAVVNFYDPANVPQAVDFAIASRLALPALIAEVERLQAVIAAVREAMDQPNDAAVVCSLFDVLGPKED